MVAALTLILMLAQILARPWLFDAAFPRSVGVGLRYAITCVRLAFLPVFVLILYQGIVALREIARSLLSGAGLTIPGDLARVRALSRRDAGRGNHALVGGRFREADRARDVSIDRPVSRRAAR